MRRVTATAKTIEHAIAKGLLELRIAKKDVEINIIQQPVKGVLGLIGMKPAIVELIDRRPESVHIEEPSIVDNQVAEAPDFHPVNTAVSFLTQVGQSLNMDVQADVKEDLESVRITLTSASDLGVLIGKKASTLDALQFLTNVIVNQHQTSNAPIRITLDAENYRERRKITLEKLAERVAGQVIRNKADVELEPMSPLDRKTIHTYLHNHPRVQTVSIGEQASRRIVVSLKRK